MAEVILPLDEAADIKRAGGKGAALARIIRAGFKVPDGFVITTGAYGIAEAKPEIMRAYDSLGAKYVAVRSSAVGEDSKTAAWAGQLDTFLNVSRDGFMEAVKKCWQSADSERAQFYARQHNLQSTEVAVVVQEMIQSEVSGIGFSVNPITKDAGQIIIEAGYGLNEPIVSGEITPDTYIISKNSTEILEKHIANQVKKLSLGASDNEWQKVADGAKQKLSDERIKELVDNIVRLEEFFGFPVDMEWTIADDKLFILQSRPITTLG